MKLFIIYALAGFSFLPDSGFYSISVNRPGGGQISMSQYRGRKVLIVPFNAIIPDTNQLIMLDSIQRKDSGLVVLAIPAGDISGDASDTTLNNIKNSLGVSLVMTRSVPVRRSSGNNQHPLFKWLTSVAQNTHFDRDVEQEGQLFFINEKGTLYGILNKGASGLDIAYVLKQQITQ